MVATRNLLLHTAAAFVVGFGLSVAAVAQTTNAAPPPASTVNADDPFGEQVTLPEQTIVYVAGSGQWDTAYDTIIAAFKTVNGALNKLGVKPDGAPMLWAGVMGWGADYPDPSDFFTPILSCASRGAWNWADYCSPAADAKAAEANALADPAREAERIARWKEVYRMVMDDAPWVPVYNDKRVILRSKRLAGPEGAFVAPVLPLIDYPQVYVADAK